MNLIGSLLELLLEVLGVPWGSDTSPLLKAIRANKQKHYVLLIATPTSKQAEFQEQKALFSTITSLPRGHDIVVMHVLHGELIPFEKALLYQDYGLHLKEFEVILIGKDGKVKLRSGRPLVATALFEAINRLPTHQ